MTILAFLKNWPLLGGFFGSWGHALVTVAVVEWLKQESCPLGQKSDFL